MKGQGSVENLPDGRARMRLPRSLSAKRAGAIYSTEAEARTVLAETVRVNREAQRRPRDTLAGWGEVVLQRRQEQGLATAKDDAGRWAHVLDSDLAPMLLRAIQPQHVRDFARWLSRRPATRPGPGGARVPTGAPISRQTQQHVLNLLRVVLEEARLDGLLGQAAAIADLRGANPARDVGPAQTDEGEDIDAWTWLRTEEIAQLLACEEIDPEIRDLYAVAIYTGLRQGEMWPLRWERVRLDDERPQIVVAKSNKRRSTKGKKVRAVPLLPQALAALSRIWERAGRPDVGLVFPSPVDPRQQRSQGDDAGWACKRRGDKPVQRGARAIAGLRADIRFHDLRHTCASHLLQGTWGRRWRMEEVRDFLGHSSITVTQRYAHLCAEALHEAAAATRTDHLNDAVELISGATRQEGRYDPERATTDDHQRKLAVVLAEKPPRTVSATGGAELVQDAVRAEDGSAAGWGAAAAATTPTQDALTGPRSGPRPTPATPTSATARPAGIEPAAHGLEGRTTSEDLRGVTPSCGPVVGRLAEEVIQRAAAGEDLPADLAEQLARAVLADPLIELAQQVLQGGHLAYAYALRLAGLVLQRQRLQASEADPDLRRRGA